VACAELSAITGLDQERTPREIARIAYADPRKLFASDGSPIPIHQLDADTAATVEVVEGPVQYRVQALSPKCSFGKGYEVPRLLRARQRCGLQRRGADPLGRSAHHLEHAFPVGVDASKPCCCR
jgi:hypothetical protein